MTRLLIAFTILLSGFQTFAHEAREQKPIPCEASLRPSFESWAQISHINGPIVVDAKPNIQTYEFFVALSKYPGVEVGHMKFELEGDVLHIRAIFLNDGFKDMGASRYLFAKALATFPQTEKVQATLVGDNAAFFKEEFERTGNQIAAFKNTPFYKAFKKLGFSDIVAARSYVTKDPFTGLESRILTLQRPGSNPALMEELAKPKSIFRLAPPSKPAMF